MSMEIRLILVLLVLVGIFFAGRLSITQSRQYISDTWALKRYTENHLSKVGSTSMYGGGTNVSYILKSFDGGKSWWDLKYDENRKIISIEPADPKLIEHHDAMIELGNYVREHGSINGGDPAGINILEAAGFSVEVK